MPWVGLQFSTAVNPDHTHLLSGTETIISDKIPINTLDSIFYILSRNCLSVNLT